MSQKITVDEQDSRAAVLDGLEHDEPQAASGAWAPRKRTAQPSAPAIYGQMVDVMAELQVITPDKQGPEIHQSYPYVSSAKVTAHLHQLLAKHRIAVAPRVLDKRVDVTFAPNPPAFIQESEHKQKMAWRGKVESTRTLAVVEMEFTFFSAIDGSSMVVSGVAEAADTGDKALSKAVTTAYKKAMLQTFMIVSEEPDVDYGNIEEEQETADARSVLKDRGEQHREKARTGRKTREQAQTPPEPVASEPETAEEPAPEPEQAPEPEAPAEAPAKVEEPAPAAPAPKVEDGPETADALTEAKRLFREAVARRAQGGAALSPVEVDALAEKVTGKQRPDWIKSANEIKRIVKAIDGGEVA